MADRSWFYASDGQQLGPYPEGQLRDLISRGMVRPDTLVWTEGMAGWQKAAEIPGLVPTGSGPPSIPQAGGPAIGGYRGGAAGGYGDGALSADLPIWALLGRSILYVIGMMLVIPAPWVATHFYRWGASRTSVPGRPNFEFTGQVADIWYLFIGLALMSYVGQYDNSLQLIAVPVEAFLGWLILRWIAANLSSNGQPLPIAFNGNVWTFIGWQVLMVLSIFTIIGWAWVMTAMVRWICRNIGGTRREIVFNASGLEMLWRSLLFGFGCVFLIPIPWVLRWYVSWYISQFVLVERGAYANA
jgi:GYF domain 2